MTAKKPRHLVFVVGQCDKLRVLVSAMFREEIFFTLHEVSMSQALSMLDKRLCVDLLLIRSDAPNRQEAFRFGYKLRSRCPNTPILLVGSSDYLNLPSLPSRSTFIPGPFRKVELLATIKDLIESGLKKAGIAQKPADEGDSRDVAFPKVIHARQAVTRFFRSLEAIKRIRDSI